jgi:hypothetical protein
MDDVTRFRDAHHVAAYLGLMPCAWSSSETQRRGPITKAGNGRMRGSQGFLAGTEGNHPMGDAESCPIRLSFNPQLRVEFGGATVTSDAGLLLPRELDERLGLSSITERRLTDPRTGRLFASSPPG